MDGRHFVIECNSVWRNQRNQSMYCKQLGSGPDVVLLHGWGWHAGVWDDVARRLASEFRVWLPDLLGHGRRRARSADLSLDGLVDLVCSGVPEAAAWIGWSLGGLVALRAARAGVAHRVVLVGTTPRFVQDTDWKHGLPRKWFRDFTEELAHDAERAFERFASLHLAGNGNERSLLRRLRRESEFAKQSGGACPWPTRACSSPRSAS